MSIEQIAAAGVPSPLTHFNEEERLFRRAVAEFAAREIRPLVREMDEHAQIPRSLIDKLFDLGVMGVEIPDEFGGGGPDLQRRTGAGRQHLRGARAGRP